MNGEEKIEVLKREYKKVSMDDLQYGQLKGAISRGKKAQRMRKIQKMAAVAAVFIFAFVALPNVSKTMASAMKDVPVLGKLVTVVTFREYHYDDEEKSADVKIPKVEVKKEDVRTTESRKEASVARAGKTADEINAEVQQLTKKIIRNFRIKLKKKGYQSVTVRSEVLNQNDRYFTLKLICDEAMADGYEESTYYTMDLDSGKRIRLKDLFKEGSDYITLISENIQKQMRDQMKADESKSYWIDDKDFPDDNFKTIRPDEGFYMNEKNEIIIVFNEGDVAPMSMGAVEFVIPDNVISGIRVE